MIEPWKIWLPSPPRAETADPLVNPPKADSADRLTLNDVNPVLHNEKGRDIVPAHELMAPQHGLEPRTRWLTAICSAN